MNWLRMIMIVTVVVLGQRAATASNSYTDLSTTEDGISPSLCTDRHKHCVFRHNESMQEITSVTVREGLSGASELSSFAKAQNACAKLENWGGHSDWRLPTFGELYFYREWISELFDSYPFLNPGTKFFWTSAHFIGGSYLPDGVSDQNRDRYWAVQLNPYIIRQLDSRAVIGFLCIRDDFPLQGLWRDDSLSKTGEKMSCGSSAGTCIFTDKANGIEWKSSSGYVHHLAGRDLSTNFAEDANQICLNEGGSGWRLPTLAELAQANQDGISYLPLRTNFLFQLAKSTFLTDSPTVSKFRIQRGDLVEWDSWVWQDTFQLAVFPKRPALGENFKDRRIPIVHIFDCDGDPCIPKPGLYGLSFDTQINCIRYSRD